MSVSFQALNGGLERTAGAFLNANANFTIMYWATNTVGTVVYPDYLTYHLLANVAYDKYVGVYSVGDGTFALALTYDIGSGSVAGDPVPLIENDAYHLCYVYDNTAKTLKFYVNKQLFQTLSVDLSGITFGHDYLGYDGFSNQGLTIQNYRSWQRALTAAQIDVESTSDNAVLLTNLFCDTPLPSSGDLADDSGNARNWSSTGVITSDTTHNVKFISDSNLTAATATVLPDMTDEGYRLVQDAMNSGVVADRWFTYTAISGDNVLGIRIFGDNNKYKPSSAIYTGTVVSLTQYYSFGGGTNPNIPIQFPVTPGVQYWIKIKYNDGTATEAPILFQISRGPNESQVDGDWLITDDVDNLPTVIRDISTGEVKGFIQAIASGEFGDSLETTPVYLISNENAKVAGDRIYTILYDQYFVEITRLLLSITGTLVRANPSMDLFYSFREATNQGFCYQIEPDGTLTLITSDITVPVGENVLSIGVSPDGNTLYYAGKTNATGLTTAIYRWDLQNNAPLTLLFNSVATDSWRNFDGIIVNADGTLLFCIYRFTDSSVQVLHISDADGSVLNTYSFGTNNQFPGGGTPPRISRDASDTHFRIMRHTDTPDGYTLFQRVKISDGTITTIITAPEYEIGFYEPGATPTPVKAFGNSFSCPLLLAVSDSAPGTGTIIVTKVVSGGPDDVEFDFTAGGGLSPGTFSLADEDTQIFADVAPGTYSIAEDAVAEYDTDIAVSNGDDPTSINLGAGDTITVTVTNTFIGVNPLSGIYKLVPDKRNDTLWTSFDPEETEDVKIPDPFFKTGLLGK